MPRGKPDANSDKSKSGYEYNKLVAEINELDRVSTYVRGGPDGRVQMIYDDHIIEMFREEVERRLEFLRKIKGNPCRAADCGRIRQKKGIDYAD